MNKVSKNNLSCQFSNFCTSQHETKEGCNVSEHLDDKLEESDKVVRDGKDQDRQDEDPALAHSRRLSRSS